MELEDFIKRVDAFALERDWAQFHCSRIRDCELSTEAIFYVALFESIQVMNCSES